MRIVLLGPSRHPVAEPFAGGQESFVATLATALRGRGHHVTMYAAAGSDPRFADDMLTYPALPQLSEVAALDFQLPEPGFLRDQHAFLWAVDELMRRRADIDLVHNNSLHHLPLAASQAVGLPLVTTLHTPPFPWMELGVALADPRASFVAVSSALAAQWTTLPEPAHVIPNGVAVGSFAAGPGGEGAVWAGRLVPEKGADLAARAAVEAGRELRLIGPMGDPEWFDDRVRPLLSRAVTYEGHLTHTEVARALGDSAVTMLTPRWDEPFGLIAVESALTGTPVAALARGGVTEVLDHHMGVLVRPHDSDGSTVSAVARALSDAATLPRDAVRASATARFDVGRMAADYERVYAAAVARW